MKMPLWKVNTISYTNLSIYQFVLSLNIKENLNKISNLNNKTRRSYPPCVMYARARDSASHDTVCYCHLAATHK